MSDDYEANGVSTKAIAASLSVSPASVKGWRDRFAEEGLAKLGQVRKGPGRKPSIPQSRPIKIVSIVDEHTRDRLGGMVERSITGEHLIAELDRLAGQRDTYPAVLRCDN